MTRQTSSLASKPTAGQSAAGARYAAQAPSAGQSAAAQRAAAQARKEEARRRSQERAAASAWTYSDVLDRAEGNAWGSDFENPYRTVPGNVPAMNQMGSQFALQGSGGGGGGGGGYGGGGGGGSASAQRTADLLKQLLQSGQFTAKPNEALRSQVGGAVDRDLAFANTTYDGLDQALAAYANPYDNVQVGQAPTQDAALAALLQSQGADVGAYSQQLGASNSEAMNARSGMEDLRRILGASDQSSQNSRVSEAAQARAFSQNELGAQRGALEALLAQRQADEQRQLDQQRLQLITQLAQLAGSGANIDLAGLLG